MSGGYVYIMTNEVSGTLYIGVTADLVARVTQHRDGTGSDFWNPGDSALIDKPPGQWTAPQAIADQLMHCHRIPGGHPDLWGARQLGRSRWQRRAWAE